MTENPSPETKTHVFVYGTLKRGYAFHYALENQTFVGEATTTADYRMYSLGDYPGLIEVEPGCGVHVRGEVYRVDQNCLQQLDRIEGVDQGLYERKEIRFSSPLDLPSFPPGESTLAYFYLGDLVGCTDCGDYWRA